MEARIVNSSLTHKKSFHTAQRLVLILMLALTGVSLTGCGSDYDDRTVIRDNTGGSGGNNDGGNDNTGGNNGNDNSDGGNNNDGDTGGDNDGEDTATDPNLTAFAKNVHPLTSQHCVMCHQSTVTPFHGHSDVNIAFQAVMLNRLVNLDNPGASRLVTRLRDDKHQCWDGSCPNSAMEMQTAIQNWANEVSGTSGSSYNFMGISTTAAAFEPGNGSTRDNSGVIALYDFSTGNGTTIFDRSGVEPALNLTLNNGQWIAGNGVTFGENSSATADAESSKKLFDLIAGEQGSQAYTVEAWVVPANTDQNGPARIVSYSDGTQNRNFTMGQENDAYSFRNRNSGGDVGNNGTPALESNMDDGQVTTNLQHVVMTYEELNGRSIYVDTRKVDVEDSALAADLSNWNDGYQFILANETTNNRQWQGQILMVAIYNKALSETQVKANFNAGVGEKFLVRFNISSLVEAPDTFIQFEAAEFDAYSYLFGRPTLIAPQALNNVPLRGMRIAINDSLPVAGQSYSRLDVELSTDGQLISPIGTILAKDKGVETDRFKLAFEVLGANQNVYVEATPQAPPIVNDGTPATELNGVRTFDQIFDTLVKVTGIDPNDNRVRNVYLDLKTQFPTSANMASFVSGHQVAINKLSLEFCDRLVERDGYRSDFFGSDFRFGSGVNTAFAGEAEVAIIVDALWNNVIGSGMEHQPEEAAFKTEITTLVNELISHAPNGDAARTRSIVKGACLAVLAGSAITVH